MVFYLSIVLYISSVIGALVLMILGKNMDRQKFFLLAGVHGFLLLVFLASLVLKTDNGEQQSLNFFFLLFICSGVWLTGQVWRIHTPLPLRIYFSLYAITFPLFLFSPSMLVNFLLTTHYTETLGKTFQVKDNYYLEQQNSWSDNSGKMKYKLVVKKGIFTQTLSRDIDFKGSIDSCKTITFDIDSSAVLRGYRLVETYVSTSLDSIDVTVPLKQRKLNQIERRLTP